MSKESIAKKKRIIYVQPEIQRMLDELYTLRRLMLKEPTNSGLFCEGLEMLHKKEFESLPSRWKNKLKALKPK